MFKIWAMKFQMKKMTFQKTELCKLLYNNNLQLSFPEQKFWMEFLMSKPLKTKGFSHKTEALIWIGGGERQVQNF